ncbi:unnamed protein product [Heligmosomoides polygyrus]|uniref:Uncharacterized protein n=1 Tax=Heligmosomoides polygyrus TaxID=6339 RepID=A0A183FQN8_HELPZ|nr:unnamed protein product [Heligmosomoides polygyrus]
MPSVLVCVLAPEKEIRAEDDTEWGGPEPTGRSADDDGSGGADDAITLTTKHNANGKQLMTFEESGGLDDSRCSPGADERAQLMAVLLNDEFTFLSRGSAGGLEVVPPEARSRHRWCPTNS